MHVRIYGAHGHEGAATVPPVRTGYAGAVGEADEPWYLLGSRFYMPWLRCFISPDAASPFDAGGLNRYAYCLGDPINRIDPSGDASFGWLGKLLGHVLGAVGSAANAVAKATPTTALTAIGAVADGVTVGAVIGAVAADALGDAPAAGLLGWVALSSGLGGMGLGVAGQAVGKSARSVNRRPSSTPSLGRTSTLSGPISMGKDLDAHMFSEPGNRTVRHVSGEGLRDLPALTGRITQRDGGGFRVEPKTLEWANADGGRVIGFDARVQMQHIEMVARQAAVHAEPGQVVNVFLGGHGDPVGRNWEKPSGGIGRGTVFKLENIDADSKDVLDILGPRLRKDFSSVRIHDVGKLSGAEYRWLLAEEQNINVLGMCFSIADVKANKVRVSLSSTGRAPNYTVYDRPYGV